MLEERDLRFPTPEERYVFDRGGVVCWGQDGKTRVRCEISREALDDQLGADCKVKANRGAIDFRPA
jgi:hypothetical protein